MLPHNGQGLPRSAMLKSKKEMQAMFTEGKSVFAHPLKIVYTLSEDREFNYDNGFNLKIAFSVSKKKYKKSTDRNKIKRLCREAYRLNVRNNRIIIQDSKIRMMVIYIAKDILSYEKISSSMIRCLKEIFQNGGNK